MPLKVYWSVVGEYNNGGQKLECMSRVVVVEFQQDEKPPHCHNLKKSVEGLCKIIKKI